MATKEQIYEVLHTCYDPEIPVNIVDLGLIYEVEVNEDKVAVKMTLTTPGCGVNEASVDLVWDPPWNPSLISEEAKQKLGM